MNVISEGLTAWLHVLFLDACYEWKYYYHEKTRDEDYFYQSSSNLNAFFVLNLVTDVLLETLLFLQLLPELRIALNHSLPTLFLRHPLHPISSLLLQLPCHPNPIIYFYKPPSIFMRLVHIILPTSMQSLKRYSTPQKKNNTKKKTRSRNSLLAKGDQDKQNKITRYFQNFTPKPRVIAEETKATVHVQPKEVTLSERLNKKEKEVGEIRNKYEQLKGEMDVERIKNMERQLLLAATMLKLANIARQQKSKINAQLGTFTQNFKVFNEGPILQQLRANITNTEQQIKKYRDQLRFINSKEEEYNRIQCNLLFKVKKLEQYEKEFDYRQLQIIEMKQGLKLVSKEKASRYCMQGWPIIYRKYQTLELLGYGGFGEVYKCYDLEKNRLVAIKRMNLQSVKQEHYLKVFRKIRRETEIHKRLNHPNIVKLEAILELSQSKKCAVIELQYCLGPELSKFIKRNRNIAENEAKVIIKQVLCALKYLYSLPEKIIHYDLKPSNIIFHEGIVKIVDFGLSKLMIDEDSIELTSQGVGTYWYLPPEAFQSQDPKISPKVDIWSLGVIFYEILYGKKPFGEGVSQMKIYEEGIILNARRVNFDKTQGLPISKGAKSFIEACLSYNPEDRPTPLQALQHEYMKND